MANGSQRHERVDDHDRVRSGSHPVKIGRRLPGTTYHGISIEHSHLLRGGAPRAAHPSAHCLYSPTPEASLRPTIPVRMSAMLSSRIAVAGSRKSTMPSTAVPTVPTPVHTA